MKAAIEMGGNLAALAGIVMCLVAGAARATGEYYVLGFTAMTMFTVGTGLMVMGCLAKLHLPGRR